MIKWKRSAAVLSLLVGATAGTVLTTAGPAAASDTFAVVANLDNCRSPEAPNSIGDGFLEFEDYGPGAKGGGNNDDYLLLGDTCPNYDGVKGWVWLDGVYLGDKYNGEGFEHTIVWDPFGNLIGKHSVGLKVCSVDGNAGTPYACMSYTKTIDG